MKRIGSIDGVPLFDLALRKENIMEAIDNASKDHAHDPQVIQMKENKEDYAYWIWQEIHTAEFHFSKFRSRDIYERGKKRHLCYTVTFPDRVIQHVILQIVGPILLGTSVRDSYAAQKGKGTHLCSMKVREAIYNDPEGTKYYLKEDIKKYFDNIPRDILFNLIKRKIKDRKILNIIHEFIFGAPGRKGLPIGMYSSQIFSSFMLTYFDHWVKEVLRIKHCFRYMDDWVCFSNSKAALHRIHVLVKAKLKDDYRLELKSNWRIAPTATGLDFVGYVHYLTHVLLRKRNKIRYKRVCNLIKRNWLKGIPPTINQLASARSYDGMASWCDAKRLRHLNFGQIIQTLGNPYDTTWNSQGHAGCEAC